MTGVESVLDKIVTARRASVAKGKESVGLAALKAQDFSETPFSLSGVLKWPGLSLIAEAKTVSPSRGVIRSDLAIPEIVEIYESAGAAAISILTEPDYFNGSWTHLRAAREFSGLPIICKDFIIDEWQIYMARAGGADAVLLIAAVLDDAELARMIDISHHLEMEVLTEAVNKDELDRVIAGKTDVIGINNRDLHTLKVDINTCSELLEGLPHDRPIVVESGVHTREDAVMLEKKGADGILVGTALMESADITAKVKELLGKD